MILERLTVGGFRSFANRYTFVPDANFTVISAPNGAGKSTLLDALYYGLLERHTVTGEEAKARFLCSGRTLTPSIEIDFTVGAERYRLSKTFLGEKSSSLKTFERGSYVARCDSSAADNFVRDLFAAEPAGRGAIDRGKHLGLAHVLWSPAHANFDDLPTKAGETIRGMLDAAYAAVTDGEQQVANRVEEEYLKYYTPGGAFATAVGTANVPEVERSVAEAQEAAIDARTEHLRYERLSTEYADREADVARMVQRRDELRAQVVAARANVAAYIDLTSSADRAASDVASTQKAYADVAERIEKLQERRLALQTFAGLHQRASEELAEAVKTATAMAARVAALRETAENATNVRATVQRRAEAVTAAEAFTTATAAIERFQRLLDVYEASSVELARLTRTAATIVGPTRDELAALSQAAIDYARLQATIAASALALEFTAHVPTSLDVIAGDATGLRSLGAGETTTIAATDDSVVIDLPGIGRIRARGADGAKKARKDLAPIAAMLEAARMRYGTSATLELADRTERAAALEQNIADLTSTMSLHLGGVSADDVCKELAEAQTTIDAHLVVHPDWRTAMPDARASRTAFDHDLQKSGDASDAAQRALRAAELTKAEFDKAVDLATTHVREHAFDIEKCTTAIDDLEADGADDARCQERLRAFALANHGAVAKRDEIAESLRAYTEDPRETVEALLLAEEFAGEARSRAQELTARCGAQLEAQMARGNYPRLVLAEEAVLARQDDLANVRSKAAAIKILHDAFERVRIERVAAVVEPVAAAATRYFHRIAGSTFGSIEIGEGLAPCGLVAGVSQRSMPVVDGTLSSGEKEQVYLSTRLALAEIIARKTGERQLFVVDDALTATDPYRLRRFMRVLEELSQEYLQVIVTTADSSRYMELAGAKHLDLAAALAEESAA